MKNTLVGAMPTQIKTSPNSNRFAARFRWCGRLISALFCCGLLATAPAQTFTNLHSLTGNDGYSPQSDLILSGNSLYGTASGGGNSDRGTVFKVNTDGTGFTKLLNFAGFPTDASGPIGGLILSGNTLYGTTELAGPVFAADGTVFKISTNGTGYTNLHVFDNAGRGDGSASQAALILSGNTLFGTARYGGNNFNGTLFKVNTDGSGFTNLYRFNGSDGANPQSALIKSGNTLYGTTAYGGNADNGTVFAINADGTGFTSLHSFTTLSSSTNSDGARPYGELILSANTLYGTAFYGGSSGYGTVFAVNTDGTGFTNLYSFPMLELNASQTLITNSAGANPHGGLILSGNTLYGTASAGGSSGNGTVFALNTDGAGFTNLYSFTVLSGPFNSTNSDGAHPEAGLILSGNTLYGTTRYGGITGGGTVFRISLPVPPNQQAIVANPIPDTNSSYGSAFDFTFAANTFSDPDAGQTLMYTASNLPPGITFDGPTRTFSGTPTNIGPYAVTVTVMDDGVPPLGANTVFNFAITAAPLTVMADNTNRFFGQANPFLTGTLTGVTNGDNITATFSTTATQASPAGNYPITPELQDPDNRLGNYTVTTNLGVLDIVCPTNLVVITTNDSGPGSLREAITLANLSCAPDVVLISFNIPGAGVQTIAPLTELPIITQPVTIDGYSQPGASPNTLAVDSDAVLLIELNGTNLPGSSGLYLATSASNSLVSGLAINRWSYGIGLEASASILEGNFIGTDATGTNAQPNDIGVAISGTGNRIGGLTPSARNVISGNTTYGIWLTIGTSNLMVGNYMGLGPDGTTPVPNTAGIHVSGPSTGNQIGGTTPNARNVISANGDGCYDDSIGGNVYSGNFIGTDASGTLARGNSAGITVLTMGVIGGTNAGAGNLISGWNSSAVILGSSNVVAGNLIGTDVTGQLALGNEYDGVLVFGSGNLIGGTGPAARNVIAANRYGIFFFQPTANNNRVLGNYIGTDVTGTNGLGNASGIVSLYAPLNIIGGATAAMANVISASTNGAIEFMEGATNNIVQGNFIGTDVTGTALLPNGRGIGANTAGNLIGGTGMGEGNVIAGNSGIGVAVGETNNAVLGNRMFANGALGIDLFGDGVNPNDLGDADSGPNHFQNSPEITSVDLVGANLTVTYRVESAPANSAYPLTVEFFLADSGASGEGRTLIHRHTYDTPQTFTNITFTPAATVNDGDPIVATATDANGNTSEFSASAPATSNRSPIVANPIPGQSGTYGNAFSFTFATNVFTDPDAGQTLTFTASSLPPGITFDGPTRTFSGTNTDVGTNLVLVMATDDGLPQLTTNALFQFIVNKAPMTITADNTSRAYGGFANYTLSFAGLVLDEQWWNLNFFPYAYSLADSTSPVGAYPVTVSGGTDSHYEITLVDGVLTITNAPLVVRGDRLCRPVGQANPPLTGTLVGLQNNDIITANFTTTATPASPLGDYPITVSSLADPNNKLVNYAVTQINGALHVVDFATDLQVLHSFGFTNLLGRSPQGRLIEGSDGMLYGTAYRGGIAGIGVVFRINRDSTGYQVIHHFAAGGSAGAGPRAGVIEGNDGALYGTTLTGGSGNVGTVFKLNKDGSDFTVLREFTGAGGDGAEPGDLIQGTNDVLYGFTDSGGSGGTGTLFQLNTNGGGYGVVHHFNFATEGAGPRGLSQGSDGLLYGATTYGGVTFDGCVFKVDLGDAVFSVIHDFNSSTEGGNAAVREGSDQVLYGCAYGGGTNYSGTIFKLNRDGSGFTVLFTFPSYWNHGSNPKAEVVEGNDGALYGTTSGGGTNGSGTVFKLNKDGSGYTVLRHLGGYGGTDARSPFDALLKGSDGVLYGTSYSGGFASPNDDGTLFRLNADGSGYGVLWRFSYGGGDGLSSQAALVEGSDGALYGTTEGGGVAQFGTVFRISKNGSGYQLLHSFSATGAEGMFPQAALLEGSNGRLYGSTREPYPGGTLFSLNKDGSDFQVLYTFGSVASDGEGLKSALVEGPGGVLFGVTSFGGTQFGGIVFSIRLSGTAYSILRHSGFDETYRPQGVTLGSDGALYVMAAGSSFPDGGSVFRMNQDGTGFQVLRTLGIVAGDGYTGAGSLIQATNGLLYGVTTYGGAHFGGTIFKMNLDGTGYSIIRSLGDGGHDARNPTAALAQGPDGALYGNAYAGLGGLGALFRITLDGSDYCVIHNFATAGGYGALSRPGLISGSDGAIYGTADSGGVSGFGTIFKLSISPASLNAPPFVLNFISDQTNTYGNAFTYTFPINIFNDPDASQVLSFGASGLPPGISFDAGARTFSGTNTSAGSYSLSVTATDNGSPALSTNDIFNFVVDKAPLTVSAHNTNRPYGEADPTFNGALVGVTNSDNLTAAFTTTATLSSAPGNYPITPALQDPNSRLGNYIVTTNLAVLTVNGVAVEFGSVAGSLTFCWPTTAAAFLLEYTDDLTPPVTWQSVTIGITTNGPNICLTVAPEAATPSRFYRLRLP